MSQLVVSGATLSCSFGLAPSTLTVIPPTVDVSGVPAANIMDYAPMVNVASFGMCITQANPAVAAATSAALGTPTPAPCVPVTTAPWAPGAPTVLLRGSPALTATCQCMCTWGGVITITQPGQATVSTSAG